MVDMFRGGGKCFLLVTYKKIPQKGTNKTKRKDGQ